MDENTQEALAERAAFLLAIATGITFARGATVAGWCLYAAACIIFVAPTAIRCARKSKPVTEAAAGGR